ncbi:MAG: competence/damage-inducible protein A [Proteobacteria bacterium]|nr:competence/damage-inducible protein A [Pseudomonadota bacterium]
MAVTAALIIIGNEVLSGRTRDANLQFIARRLVDIGIRLAEARVIADTEDAIIAAVNQCRAAHDFVFTTGGIGPTHDDITSRSVARAFGVALVRDPVALALLEKHYEGRDLNDARLKMADIPEGAGLIHNPVSKAPGFQIENVFVLAGVPSIMEAMFEGIKERLTGGEKVASITITAFIPEGDLAGPFGRLQEEFPAVEMGSYPFFRGGRLGSSLVLRSADGPALAAAAESLRAMIRDLGSEPEEDGEDGD